jgi:hypothetical protein
MCLRRQGQQAVGVVGCVNFIPQAQICQRVHVDPVPQGNSNRVLAEFDAEHGLSERQLTDLLRDVVVPYQDAVWRGMGGRPTADDRHQVATEQHFDLAYTTPKTPLDAQ